MTGLIRPESGLQRCVELTGTMAEDLASSYVLLCVHYAVPRYESGTIDIRIEFRRQCEGNARSDSEPRS